MAKCRNSWFARRHGPISGFSSSPSAHPANPSADPPRGHFLASRREWDMDSKPPQSRRIRRHRADRGTTPPAFGLDRSGREWSGGRGPNSALATLFIFSVRRGPLSHQSLEWPVPSLEMVKRSRGQEVKEAKEVEMEMLAASRTRTRHAPPPFLSFFSLRRLEEPLRLDPPGPFSQSGL